MYLKTETMKPTIKNIMMVFIGFLESEDVGTTAGFITVKVGVSS